jgi:hypothetical protein
MQRPQAPWRTAIVAVVLLALPAGGGAWVWLTRSARVFSLTLELNTPQGEREIRVLGTEVTLEERERRSAAVTHSCDLGLLDYFALRRLARATLNDRELDKKVKAGTFAITLGDDDPQNGNGDVDAEQAAALSDFVVKHSRGCVDTAHKL